MVKYPIKPPEKPKDFKFFAFLRRNTQPAFAWLRTKRAVKDVDIGIS
jgi:hypothetical protein